MLIGRSWQRCQRQRRCGSGCTACLDDAYFVRRPTRHTHSHTHTHACMHVLLHIHIHMLELVCVCVCVGALFFYAFTRQHFDCIFALFFLHFLRLCVMKNGAQLQKAWARQGERERARERERCDALLFFNCNFSLIKICLVCIWKFLLLSFLFARWIYNGNLYGFIVIEGPANWMCLCVCVCMWVAVCASVCVCVKSDKLAGCVTELDRSKVERIVLKTSISW